MLSGRLWSHDHQAVAAAAMNHYIVEPAVARGGEERRGEGEGEEEAGRAEGMKRVGTAEKMQGGEMMSGRRTCGAVTMTRALTT